MRNKLIGGLALLLSIAGTNEITPAYSAALAQKYQEAEKRVDGFEFKWRIKTPVAKLTYMPQDRIFCTKKGEKRSIYELNVKNPKAESEVFKSELLGFDIKNLFSLGNFLCIMARYNDGTEHDGVFYLPLDENVNIPEGMEDVSAKFQITTRFGNFFDYESFKPPLLLPITDGDIAIPGKAKIDIYMKPYVSNLNNQKTIYFWLWKPEKIEDKEYRFAEFSDKGEFKSFKNPEEFSADVKWQMQIEDYISQQIHQENTPQIERNKFLGAFIHNSDGGISCYKFNK